MTEKVRDYKKRIDAEWKKNEMDRDKLIRKIKEYELLDEEKKEGIEKEILEVFSKKENEAKGENYTAIARLIEDVDKKYEVLEQLREELREKEKERDQNEKRIRRNKPDRSDLTTVYKQITLQRELEEEREKIELKIEEIKKEISDMEEEIKDVEEEYGKKPEIDEIPEDEFMEDEFMEDDFMEDNEISYSDADNTPKIEPTTLKEYHDQVIKDLREKDRIRKEIVKILEEGERIGNCLSRRIDKELADAFFKYYDEKQGTLRMKAGRREKNKQNRSTIKVRGKIRKRVPEKLEMEEEVVNTSRQIRESLILQWYEKKLNRDEFLRVLDENEMMDKKSKKKLKEEIIKEFYENYEKAKEGRAYKLADEEYRYIRATKKQLEGKVSELAIKRKEGEEEMKMIDEEMETIAQNVVKFEKGSWWWNKRKLEKAKTRRDELDKQERKIKSEIGKLEREARELRLLLKEKTKRYGPRIERSVNSPQKIERKMSKEQEGLELEGQATLKGYKERYEQMIKDREEYNKKLLGAVKDMDMGISEEKKKEVLENMKVSMEKEIEELKEGDATMKKLKQTEKWLEENGKTMMEKLIDLREEIEEKEKQLDKLESKERGAQYKELIKIRKEELELSVDVLKLKDEYNQIKVDLEENLKRYDGTLVETFEKRVWRILNGKFEDIYPYNGIDIEDVKKEKMLKGYKQKYEQMLKDKEEYMNNLLLVLRTEDIRITEDNKKEVLDKLEIDMKKEIEDLKKGDETMKKAKEVENWLKENWETMMGLLIYLKKKIEEERKKKGPRFDREKKIRELREEYKQIKVDLDEKLKVYDGSHVLEEELLMETFEEREFGIMKNFEKEKQAKTSLVPYREFWKREINIDDEVKEKIIKAAEKILVRINIESDGSRMIEMKIGGKTYKILDVDIKTHSDIKYMDVCEYAWMVRDEVKLGGMKGDDLYGWKNHSLKEYVKMRQHEGLHIPKIEEMKKLLENLGKEANISEEKNQIAMLMYLTGMYGYYWLSMGNRKQSTVKNSRSVLNCMDDLNFSDSCYDTTSGILCMIAC